MSVNPTSLQSGFARSRSEALFPRLFPDAGWWCPSLNSPGGTRLHDLSGRQNWGTLTNMDAATDWVVSGGRGALDFDGSNDYVSIPDAPHLNPTQQITVSVWYNSRTTSTSFTYCLLGKSTSVNAQPYPAFDIRAAAGTTFEVAMAIGASSRQVSLGSLVANVWTHVVFAYSGSLLAGYRNGALIASSAQTGAIGTTTNPLFLGENPGFRGRYFNGQIDDVRIWSRALSSSEVRQLYQLGRGNMPRIRQRRAIEQEAGFKAYWANRRSRIIGAGI